MLEKNLSRLVAEDPVEKGLHVFGPEEEAFLNESINETNAYLDATTGSPKPEKDMDIPGYVCVQLDGCNVTLVFDSEISAVKAMDQIYNMLGKLT